MCSLSVRLFSCISFCFHNTDTQHTLCACAVWDTWPGEAAFIIYFFLEKGEKLHAPILAASFSFPNCKKKEGCWRDTMTTKANQTPAEGAVVNQSTSAPASGKKPTREVRNANTSQELQRYYDQLWNSNQRSSPPLTFYRKLSCDGEKGFILNEAISKACIDCSSEVCEKLYPELLTGIDRITDTVPLISSEGAPCQLDSPGEGVLADRNRTGSGHCSFTMSSPQMIPDMSCCPSHTSSVSPGASPMHSSRFCFSSPHPKQRHVRRSSLPVSMMAFDQVSCVQLH